MMVQISEKPEPPHACIYCGHVYIMVCDGKPDCPNRIWLDAKRKETEKEEKKE